MGKIYANMIHCENNVLYVMVHVLVNTIKDYPHVLHVHHQVDANIATPFQLLVPNGNHIVSDATVSSIQMPSFHENTN
jgi:hypothetical protein